MQKFIGVYWATISADITGNCGYLELGSAMIVKWSVDDVKSIASSKCT